MIRPIMSFSKLIETAGLGKIKKCIHVTSDKNMCEKFLIFDDGTQGLYKTIKKENNKLEQELIVKTRDLKLNYDTEYRTKNGYSAILKGYNYDIPESYMKALIKEGCKYTYAASYARVPLYLRLYKGNINVKTKTLVDQELHSSKLVENKYIIPEDMIISSDDMKLPVYGRKIKELDKVDLEEVFKYKLFNN